mmetsp:Transcript_4802/g.11441  ORF Transcript_4802/g.11441 Transcript_4802/m.11441 type:complete len:217 (+) Transcript_4802:133-783(+)
MLWDDSTQTSALPKSTCCWELACPIPSLQCATGAFLPSALRPARDAPGPPCTRLSRPRQVCSHGSGSDKRECQEHLLRHHWWPTSEATPGSGLPKLPQCWLPGCRPTEPPGASVGCLHLGRGSGTWEAPGFRHARARGALQPARQLFFQSGVVRCSDLFVVCLEHRDDADGLPGLGHLHWRLPHLARSVAGLLLSLADRVAGLEELQFAPCCVGHR